MQPRKGIFEIECSESGKDDSTFTVIPGTECVDRFKIRHSVGCLKSSCKFKVF